MLEKTLLKVDAIPNKQETVAMLATAFFDL